jgi:HPt (histidine-containing phosphotransfer) domain-containing protein
MAAIAAASTKPRTLPAGDDAIDRDHLARMALGDPSLEREVLRLFDRQSELLLARMNAAPAAAIATLAHTLKGSARGIGAWRVAEAAEAVERTAGRDRKGAGIALAQLATAIGAARTAIAAML